MMSRSCFSENSERAANGLLKAAGPCHFAVGALLICELGPSLPGRLFAFLDQKIDPMFASPGPESRP
jgi:hypothetical protein